MIPKELLKPFAMSARYSPAGEEGHSALSEEVVVGSDVDRWRDRTIEDHSVHRAQLKLAQESLGVIGGDNKVSGAHLSGDRRKKFVNQGLREGVSDPYPEPFAPLSATLRDEVTELATQLKELVAIPQRDDPRGGEHNGATTSLMERLPESLLKRLELRAYGGLRHTDLRTRL